MPNLTKIASLTLIIGLAIAPTPATADPAPIPDRGPIPFAAYDVDGSNSVSEEEFYQVRGQRMSARAAEGRPMRRAAEAPAFSKFDADGNGQLTPEELAVGQRIQMQQRRGRMGAGNGGSPGIGKNMPTFAEFDQDGDAQISEEELNQARTQRISERAKQGYLMRGLGNAPSFAEMDGNGDGQLTPEEFSVGQAEHQSKK